MKQVPYHGNPGNACALACYTMIAQYLLPELNITFEQLGTLAGWRPGYVVWPFPIWQWLMDKGVHIANFDVIDAAAWASLGTEGLRQSVSEKEFAFYQENTFNLEAVGAQLGLVFNHPNFTYERKKLSWVDILEQFSKPGICDLTLDGRKLHRMEGFTVHRVVLIDITDTEVIFHDPLKDNSGAYTHEPIAFFRSCVESLGGELGRYWLET